MMTYTQAKAAIREARVVVVYAKLNQDTGQYFKVTKTEAIDTLRSVAREYDDPANAEFDIDWADKKVLMIG